MWPSMPPPTAANLVRQTFSDRAGDEVDASETIQEKTSLSDRFGLRVAYLTLNKPEFLNLVEQLAALEGITMDREELRAQGGQVGDAPSRTHAAHGAAVYCQPEDLMNGWGCISHRGAQAPRRRCGERMQSIPAGAIHLPRGCEMRGPHTAWAVWGEMHHPGVRRARRGSSLPA